MIFWIVAALLTLLASAMVLLPVLRPRRAVVADSGHDREIYQARLEEIDRDLELGRIGNDEAAAARAEEARRLIKAVEQKPVPTHPLDGGKVKVLIFAVVVLVPLASLALYRFAGQPEYRDQQLAERMKASPEQQSVEELLAKAQTHLAKNPDDAKGWEVVAPILMRLGKYQEATTAIENIIRLKGEDADRLSALAETLIYRSGGMITADARGLLEKALQLEPENNKARFYMALALQQENRFAEARAAWNAIIADNADNQQMVSIARQQLAMMESGNRQTGDNLSGGATGDSPGNAPGNPTREQVEDAAGMDAGSRTEMIEGMVAQLREKLKDDPSNKKGWQRLFRSYGVLGRKEDMKSALDEARKAFAGDPEFLEYLAMIEAQLNKGAK